MCSSLPLNQRLQLSAWKRQWESGSATHQVSGCRTRFLDTISISQKKKKKFELKKNEISVEFGGFRCDGGKATPMPISESTRDTKNVGKRRMWFSDCDQVLQQADRKGTLSQRSAKPPPELIRTHQNPSETPRNKPSTKRLRHNPRPTFPITHV